MTEPSTSTEATPRGCLSLGPVGIAGIVLGVVAAVVAAILIINRGKEGGTVDVSQSPVTASAGSAPSTTKPGTTSTSSGASVSQPPPGTGSPGPDVVTSTSPPTTPPTTLPPDVDEDLKEAFGAMAPDVIAACVETRSFAFPGGTPLDLPALAPRQVCPVRFRADAAGGGPDGVALGDHVAIAVIRDWSATLGDPLSYQTGLALDRPGVENRAAKAQGGGFARVPIDAVAFAEGLRGWGLVDVLDPDGMAPVEGMRWHAYADPASRVYAFLVPIAQFELRTVVYSQVFGRKTLLGAQPSNQDPSVSHRVDVGPLDGCVKDPGRCAAPPEKGRFTVAVEGGGTKLTGEELGDGFFFESNDAEAVVKVLGGCSINDRFWVFASGATDVQFRVTVTDTRTAAERTYTLPGSSPLIDSDAFSVCSE